MNILLSKKDKVLISITILIYLVAFVFIQNLFTHVFLVLPFFLSIALKFYTNKRLPIVRVIIFDLLLLSLILIRIYQVYKIIKTIQKNPQTNKASQIIEPSISLPSKKEMKSSLLLALSATPFSQSTEVFPKLKVELPPVGPYCNGCYSGPPGGYAISPITKEILIADGQWISGGHFTQTGGEKWNYIYYVFKRLLPEIPQNSEMVLPGGAFLKDAIKLKVNGSQEFEMNDPFSKRKLKAYYLKLSEKINKDGITIHTFEVRPTFREDSLNRRDAIFIKNGLTYYIMFDWKTKDFDGTFDKIIDSIRFE